MNAQPAVSRQVAASASVKVFHSEGARATMYWIRSANTSAPNVRRSAAAHISMFLSTITSISLSAPPPSAVFATFASECQCWIPRRKRVRHGITAAEGVEAGNSESMFSSSGSRLHHAFHKNIRQISTAACGVKEREGKRVVKTR